MLLGLLKNKMNNDGINNDNSILVIALSMHKGMNNEISINIVVNEKFRLNEKRKIVRKSKVKSPPTIMEKRNI